MGRLRVSARLATITLVVLAVIAAATTTAWIAVGDPASQPDDTPDIDAATSALAAVRQVNLLSAAATVRTQAAMTPEALAESQASWDAEIDKLHQQIDALEAAGYAPSAATMRELAHELERRAAAVDDRRPQLAQLRRDSEQRRQELISTANWQLLPAAVASEDAVFARLISDGSDAVAPDELLDYARLALLAQQVDQGFVALEVAGRLPDRDYVATVEENVDFVMFQVEDSIEVFDDDAYEGLEPALVPLSRDLVDAAYGETNMVDMMKARLDLAAQEARDIAAVEEVSASLRAAAASLLSQTIDSIGSADGYGATAETLDAALAVGQHLSAVTATATARTAPTTPLGALPAARDAAAASFVGMRQHLDLLDAAGHGDAIAPMRSQVDRMESDVEGIHDGRAGLVEALQGAIGQRAQLRAFFDYQLRPAVVGSLDNQLYYMLTGRSEFRGGQPGDAEPLSHEELLRYRHLTLVFSSLFRTFSGFIITFVISEPTLIAEAEERFLTASHRLERSIEYLEREGGAEVHPQLIPLARQFVALGTSDENVFDSLRRRLPLIAQEAALLESNRQTTQGLQAGVDALLDEALQDAATLDPDANEPDARAIVLVIGVVAALMVLLIAGAVARRDEAETA